jgi:hypothetical protein
MQPALLRYYGNAIKLIVTQHTQQELLRYYSNLMSQYEQKILKKFSKFGADAPVLI